MRRFAVAVLVLGLFVPGAGAAQDPVLKTKKDRVSYAMAVGVARTAQRQGVEIDVSVFTRGMYDVLQGGKLLMTTEEMKEALGGVVTDLKQKQERAGAKKKAASAKQ